MKDLRMKSVIMTMALCVGMTASAQTDTVVMEVVPEKPEMMSVSVTETHQPEFPGGLDGMAKYLEQHMKVPGGLGKKKKQPVEVTFIIEKDGRIDSAWVKTPVHPKMDTEAIRLVRSFPRFRPANVRLSPGGTKWYRTRMTLPITFERKKIKATLEEAFKKGAS